MMAGMSVYVCLSVFLFGLIQQAYGEYCRGYGHTCDAPHRCCGQNCCLSSEYEHAYRTYRWNVWNMWYFWFIVVFLLMSCFGGCGYWRRRQLLLAQQGRPHVPGTLQSFTAPVYHCGPTRTTTHLAPSLAMPVYSHFEVAYPTITQVAPPQQAAATSAPLQGSFPAPPAYSEVVTKNEGGDASAQGGLPPYPGPDGGAVNAGGAAVATRRMGPPQYSHIVMARIPQYSVVAPPAYPLVAAAAPGGTTAQPPAATADNTLPPDDVDSNGNEINSNIYPSRNHMPGGDRQDGGNGRSQREQ